MKKSVLFMAAAAMVFAGMTSCQEKSPYEGYEINENGLNYRFYTQNEGEVPAIGDILEVEFGCTVNDTNAIIPTMPNLFRLEEPLFAGDFFEGLAMMHKGDSASFIVNIDSTFTTFFGQPSLPEEFNSTDVMRFDVKVNDFYPESEYKARMAEKARQAAAERIEKMKADYPEETATAAQQLQDYLTAQGVAAEPTASGLVYVMTQEGNGEKPAEGQMVKVHYTGKLLDGTVFDFRKPVRIGDRQFASPAGFGRPAPGTPMPEIPEGMVRSYDQNFCLNHTKADKVELVASLYAPKTGRLMEVLNNHPGMQLFPPWLHTRRA